MSALIRVTNEIRSSTNGINYVDHLSGECAVADLEYNEVILEKHLSLLAFDVPTWSETVMLLQGFERINTTRP